MSIKKEELEKVVSSCCKAGVKVVSGDEGTSHYECLACQKACDVEKDKRLEEVQKQLEASLKNNRRKTNKIKL